MKLGMTGSRNGISPIALIKFQNFITNNEICEGHHGDCFGADTIFHNELSKHNIKIIIHPPSNNGFRSYCNGDEIRNPLPYLERNHNIVDETDMLIGFPATKKEIIRSGTWATLRYAKKMKKKILIIYPDGLSEFININNK